jgi:Protein of unknown function (DUF3048) N-terminal domain/Protein of unknown function (DUF3048) C-terminal domain
MEQPTPDKKRHKIKQWMHTHRIVLLSIGGVILVAGTVFGAFVLLYRQPVESIPKPIVTSIPKKVVEAPKYYSPLTGNLVADQTATTAAVTGIMIENSPDARPQSGLKDAGVVFEAIAEGGITRFLALYQESKPQLIGPVRSVRMYYVDWVAAFNASVAHIGGSAGALAEVRNGNYRDIDQFFNSGAYYRATDRYAPHNVYTSFARLDALNAAKGYTSSTFTGFTRTDGKASDAPTASTVNVTISSPLYNSSYTYDKATNTYIRSQAGAPHVDRESGQITPSVVIAMRVDETTVFEDGYRQSIQAIGSGAATIFQNGIATAVAWNKPSRTSQITFTTDDGKEVPLIRGQTWISAVPNGTGDVSWQ